VSEAAALALFAVSVVPQGLLILFVRAYYSKGDTKKPLIINIVSSAVIVLLGYGFVRLFGASATFHYFVESLLKVENLSGTAILMLPLAYSIGVFLNTVLHWTAFHREFRDFTPKVLTCAYQSFASSVIMGYVAYRFLAVFDHVFSINTLAGIFLQGLCSGVIGIIAGVLVLRLLKSHELSEIWSTLHAKIWRAKVIAPEQETL